MESVDALDGFAVLRGGAEFVVRVNALEEEDALPSTSISPVISPTSRPPLASMLRASSAPPKVPVSQPPVAATT